MGSQGGTIGATLGGLAAAPFTGGMTLLPAIAAGAAAAAAGNTLGQLAGTGEVNPLGAVLSAVGGGIGGGVGSAVGPTSGGAAEGAAKGAAEGAASAAPASAAPAGVSAGTNVGTQTPLFGMPLSPSPSPFSAIPEPSLLDQLSSKLGQMTPKEMALQGGPVMAKLITGLSAGHPSALPSLMSSSQPNLFPLANQPQLTSGLNRSQELQKRFMV